jgi:hypothetical protein
MAVGTPIGHGVQARKQLEATKVAQRRAEEDRERALWMAQNMDWSPEYASEHVGPFQRSESPVADAFLSSLLTGANPAAVQGTRAGAADQRAYRQQKFDRETGGWDALRARQREMQESTPWEVKPFTREVSQPDFSREARTAARAGGLSAEEAKQLERDGFKFNEFGEFMNKSSAKSAQKAMIQGTGHTAGQADTPQGRQFMRGLARLRADGLTLNDALALGNDEIMRRGA